MWQTSELLSTFELIAKLLAELGHFGSHDTGAVSLSRMGAEVTLVVIFCWIKGLSCCHLRHELCWPDASRFEFMNFGLSDRLLITIMEKDSRAILRANIVTLPVFGRGVMDRKKKSRAVR